MKIKNLKWEVTVAHNGWFKLDSRPYGYYVEGPLKSGKWMAMERDEDGDAMGIQCDSCQAAQDRCQKWHAKGIELCVEES